ncbi:Protein STRUBBELIG-receptor family 5 [Vitis vinifera]|uniref:Protein STRUBBELIG-receptor family 5 n=1 Tax=Vitis vinifera TaxID=29760 RepID=A0A438FJU2_VITVI|nr:Protein STRUBBELIG-receptor family 5 [Vitis vinifera]
MPPECTKPLAYTLKSDVYSFGVVMLEVMTGRMPFDRCAALIQDQDRNNALSDGPPQLHEIDSLEQMVDPALRGLYPPKSLSRFADIIALCVQMEPDFRPAMSEVVQSLARLIQGASRRMEDFNY